MQLEQLKTPSGAVMQGPLLITPRPSAMTVAGFTKAGTNASSMKASANRCCSRKTTTPARSKASAGTALPARAGTPGQTGACHGRGDLRRRRRHPTRLTNLGAWVGAELSAENKCQLWIPEGFAHGFLTLSEVAEVQYKARGFWNKSCERAIAWNDPDLAIAWPIDRPQGAEVSLSDKDAEAAEFNAAAAAGDVFP